MKLRNSVAAALVIAMVGSTITGCGSSASSSGGSKDDSIYTEVGTYPILKEGEEVTISVFAPLTSSTTSYASADNLATQWLEEKTGVKFEFQSCLKVDGKQKMNTMMVSGDLPDVFMYTGNEPTASEQLLYGTQGDFIPLNDLIENYMPNLKQMLDEKPIIKENMTMQDGNMYVFTQVGKAVHTSYPWKMWINQDWLDNLGLELPTTTEEYYQVLKAFKEQDANGNGNPNDEIPLSGCFDGWNTNPIVFIMNAFGTYRPDTQNVQGMYLDDDGKVVFPAVTDEWKEGLKYLNKLCEEGLLDSLLFSQPKQELQKIGNNPGTEILGSSAGGTVSEFMSLTDSENWRHFTTVPPLEGPDGFRQSFYVPDVGKAGASITSSCEDPIAVARALDLFYTKEGTTWNRLGVHGEDYIDAEEGDLNFIGEQAEFIRVTNSAEVGNHAWSQLGAWGIPDDFDLWFKAEPTIELTLYNESAEKYAPYGTPDENIILPVAMTEEQSRRIVDIEVPMDQYIDQATAEFIMGTRDIDADWDAYVAAVEKFGLAEYIEVYQEAIDAKK